MLFDRAGNEASFLPRRFIFRSPGHVRVAVRFRSQWRLRSASVPSNQSKSGCDISRFVPRLSVHGQERAIVAKWVGAGIIQILWRMDRASSADDRSCNCSVGWKILAVVPHSAVLVRWSSASSVLASTSPWRAIVPS